MRTYELACRKVAKDLGLPYELVRRTYISYWRAVKEHVTSQPLKEDLTDEQYAELQPNVNIPSIGKLYVTLDRYKKLKKNYKTYLENKKNATHKED